MKSIALRFALLAGLAIAAPSSANAQALAGGLGPPPPGGTVTSITCNNGLTGGTITATGTCALDVAHANAWTAAQSFADGDLVLLGFTSGSSTLKAPATGGGTATLPAGSGTLVYAAGAVTSITGTANQITASGSTGAVTLSLPSTLIVPGSLEVTTTTKLDGAVTNVKNGAASTPAELFSGTIFTGGSGTTTMPLVLMSPAGTTAVTGWNTSGTYFGIAAPSGYGGRLFSAFIGPQEEVYFDNAGDIFGNGLIATNSGITFGFASYLTGDFSAGHWIFGLGDAASPVAQQIRAQGVVAGTSNHAGALWTIQDSVGTGTGASGGYEFDVHPAGGSGSSQNAASAWLTASGAGLAALPRITTDATHTDSSVCQDTTTHALYFGSGTVGVCLGTSSLRYKRNVAPLNVGLPQILALEPQSYYLKAGFGDTKKQYYGFIAERSEKVLPVLVGADKIGRANTFDYVGVIPVLVHAVQQQQQQIVQLKTQVAQLNSRMGKQQWEIDYLLKRLPKNGH